MLTAMGWLALGLVVLVLFSGQQWKGSLVGLLLGVATLLSSGAALRRFRLE